MLLRVLKSLLRDRKVEDAKALRRRGAELRQAGQLSEALADLERADRLAPNDPHCLQEIALVWFARGERARALEYCRRARAINPDLLDCCYLEAQAALGDDHYFGVLERIFDYARPRTYVEIGVFQGDSLRIVRPPTLAIGIDPEPQLTAPPAANARIFAETSDAFFARHDLRAELGGLPVELAFIDGMHQFDFALRDFANLERHCSRDATVLIHDCYPLDRATAERDRQTGFWSGDIWRLIVLLKKYRPDLSIHTVSTPPTGLGLVRHLDPDSRFLHEQYDRLREEFMALDYAYLEHDKPQKLNLVPNEWDRIRGLLSA